MKKLGYFIQFTLILMLLPYYSIATSDSNCAYKLLKERGLESYYSDSIPDVVKISYEKGVEDALNHLPSAENNLTSEDIIIPEVMREYYDEYYDMYGNHDPISLTQKRIRILSVLDTIFRYEKAIIDKALTSLQPPEFSHVFVHGVPIDTPNWSNPTVGFSYIFVDGIKYYMSLFEEGLTLMTATEVISYFHKINHIEYPGNHPPYRGVLIELAENVNGDLTPFIDPLLE